LITQTISTALSITAAVVLSMSLMSTPVAAQTLSFERQSDITLLDAPRAIAVADVTGDGWPDLILAGTGRGSVTVIPNHGVEDGDGGERFRPARDYVVGGGPFEIAIGDLNGDGRLDIAVANADSDSVTLLFNSGDGHFAAPTNLPVAGNPRGIALGDFNRDGRLDIAVTRFAAAELDVLFGVGNGTFPERRSYGAPVNPQGLAVGDFNRDGWQDVAVAAASGVIRVYEMFAAGAVIRDLRPSSHGWNVIASGDLDLDGRPDLAVASTGSSIVHLLYNRAGGWNASPAIDVASSPRGIAIADLNQDGRPEVAAAGRAASAVTVISRGGDGSIATAEVASGAGARDVALADFDRNGRVGIATANDSSRSTTVLVNRTDFGHAPAFAFEPAPAFDWAGAIFAVADFNENGTMDYLLNNRIVVDGTTTQMIDSSNFWARGGFAVDVNRDGRQDVVLHGRFGVEAYLGNGRGTFTKGLATTIPLESWGMQPADLNHDGKVDLVITGGDGRTTNALEGWLGRGDGGFTRVSSRSVSVFGGATLGDLNRDGFVDVVMADDTGVQAFLANGIGGWNAPIPFQPGVPRAGIAVGEFTGDGIPDLAMSDRQQQSWGLSWSSKISVARGVGDGSFEFLRQFDLASGGAFDWLYRLQLADVNADGALDIFTSNGHLLKGSNTGDFQAPDRFALFGTGLIVDVNHDSLPDLVGFTSRYETTGVLLNTRRAPAQNRIPTGLWTMHSEEYHWNYAEWWYAEDEAGIFTGYIADADQHAVRYTWTMNGKVAGHYEFWGPEPGTPPGRYDVTITIDDYRGGSISDSFTLIVDPFKETVLVPAEDATLYGAWQIVDDPTAAGYGQRVWHPNAGAPKLQTPLDSPKDYFEMGFIADPTQEYKLWVRLKAENDSWANDSVFVQFTGAKDASGNPLYQIGTTSALAVNLEECSGCGVSGWGWEDDGWGAVNVSGVTLRFPDGGPQTIRIQTREDGVSVDTVVLSSEKYRTTRPGAAKNDSTRLHHQGPWIGPNHPR
jgi:hypothetical protein